MRLLYVPAILYHQVLAEGKVLATYTPEKGGPPSGQLYRSKFIKQMDYLAEQGFNSITHEQLYRWLQGQAELPAKPIVIDFDDHSMTSYVQALPVMRERGLIATMFVVSGWADGDPTLSENTRATVPRMRWPELEKLLEAGWEIGAHTRSHLFLDTVSQGPKGDAQIMNELVRGAVDIEVNLGVKARHFAYPGGAWNQPRHATTAAKVWDQHRQMLVKEVFASARDFQWRGPAEYISQDTDPYRLPSMNINHLLPFEHFVMLVNRSDPQFEYYPEYTTSGR